MGVLPNHLKYTVSHEWIYIDEDGYAVIGITDFAQESLGELMSVTFPEEGIEVQMGDEVMSLESVKTQSEIYAPVTGEIVELNDNLDAVPTAINDEPYDAGWLFKMTVLYPDELDDLMTDEAYQAEIDR